MQNLTLRKPIIHPRIQGVCGIGHGHGSFFTVLFNCGLLHGQAHKVNAQIAVLGCKPKHTC